MLSSEFSPEPTREMLYCLTQEAEWFLQRKIDYLEHPQASVIREAIRCPHRIFKNGEFSIIRFWSWDLSTEDEHPVVEWLYDFSQSLSPEQYWLLRIIAGENKLEEYGKGDHFSDFFIEVIQAPRITF